MMGWKRGNVKRKMGSGNGGEWDRETVLPGKVR